MAHFRLMFCMLLVTLLSVTSLYGDRDQPYIVLRRGRDTKTVKCRNMAAAPNGRITIITDSGRLAYNRGQYVIAVIPCPPEVEKLEALLDDGRYNDLTREAPKVFEHYKYLGWADTIAKLHCEGLMALKRMDEAENFLRMAFRYPRKDEFNLQSVRLLLMVHDKKLDEVQSQLNKLMNNEDEVMHAFVFNMRAQIAEISGNKKEAVLQYLKTFLTFEDRRKFRRFRKEAKDNAVRLMKEIGDPLASVLAGMK